jgi:O-antigen/teichoic acid export membrane protein
LTEDSNQQVQVKSRTEIINFGESIHRDILYYFPVKLVPAITGLAAILILTRNLAPEEYGTYSVVMATVLIINQLFGAWLSNAVLYVYPDYKKTNDYEFHILVFRLQGFAAVVAIIIGFAAILQITQNHILGLIGALIVGSALFQFLMMTFMQSSRRVKEQSISVIAQSVIQLSALCTFLNLMKGKEIAALSAVLAGYIACLLVLSFQTKITLRNKSVTKNLRAGDIYRNLLNYGLPICIWFFATQFYTIGDRILIKLIGTGNGLGQYASFRDLAIGCAGFFSMPLLMASHPIIISMWKSGTEKSAIEQLINRNLVILTMFFVPIIVAVDLCGTETLTILFGEKYLMDKRIMMLVIVSIYLGCISMYIQKGLEVTGKTYLMALCAVITALISFWGNLVVIPRFGIFGAAMVAVLVQFLYILFIRCITINILNLKIPISLLGKLVLWVIVVEAVCRALSGLSGEHGLSGGAFWFRIVFIFCSTCVLYFTNKEVYFFYRRLFQSLRELLGYSAWNKL